MRTATISISEDMLFELIGLKDIDGFIKEIYLACDEIIIGERRKIKIKIEGYDKRLPDDENYPESDVLCTRIESTIKKR